jgi:parvulin-like peptidyl-prolyl isomerase
MAIVVNGERIEDSAIQKEIDRLRPEYEKEFARMDPAEREAQLCDWARENVIESTLLHQEIKKDGVTIPKAKIEEIFARLRHNEKFDKDTDAEDDKKLRQVIELMLRMERKFDQICKDLPKPSDDDIRQCYEENKEQFKYDEQVKVAHIVKYVDWQTDEAAAYEAIRKARDELKTSAAFEAIVDKCTDCEDSGGDLGYIPRGKMVEEFDDVVFNLGVGEVSDIFRTRFGFHIAKVYDRKPAAIPKLEDVKGEIAGILNRQMREKAIEDFIDQLKSKAKIEEI